MRINKTICYRLILLLLLSPGALLAQQPAGDIRDARVVVEKDKLIRLRHVPRRFNSIVLDFPQPRTLQLNFNLLDAADSLPPLQVLVRPRMMKDLPLDKFYGFLAKIGYGNYQSPYIMLNAGTKRNDEYMLNADFLHYSSGKGPVLDNASAAGITRFGINGIYFFNNLTLDARVDYRYQLNSIYGYNEALLQDSLLDFTIPRQKLNKFALQVKLAENNLKNDWDYQAAFALRYMATNFAASELSYRVGGQVQGGLDNWQFNAKLDFTGYQQNRADSARIGRVYARLQPVAGYRMDKLFLEGGVNVVYENDPLSNGGQVRIFPVAAAIYRWIEQHSIKAAIYGGVEKQALYDLYEQNPWLEQNVAVNANVNNLSAKLEARGLFTAHFGYTLTYTYSHYNRMLFFLNNQADSARFDLVYDRGGTTLNRLALRLDYLPADYLSISAMGAYNAYRTTDITAAWHRPQTEAEISSTFRIFDKIDGKVSYFMLLGIKARTIAGTAITLNPVHDLNFGLNLHLTDKAAVFVDLMNILGSNYQLYNNYPVKGFQVIGGFSYKF